MKVHAYAAEGPGLLYYVEAVLVGLALVYYDGRAKIQRKTELAPEPFLLYFFIGAVVVVIVETYLPYGDDSLRAEVYPAEFFEGGVYIARLVNFRGPPAAA